MRKIALNQLDALLAAIAAQQKLYVPIDTAAGAQFAPWSDGCKVSDALNTVRSPKDFFFPQTETLMKFRMEGKSIEIIDTRTESEPFVVFGVRACDAQAFDVLDRVFLATDYFDASINRVAALVIGMRNVQKAILTALLLPNEKLKELQDNGEFTKLLALQEENKLLPVGAVWDEFCTRNNVPAGSEWFKDIEDYETNVQLLRK